LRRLFAKNLLFVIGINVLVKPVWIFMIDRTVQNRVGPAAFGTYTALVNTAIVMQFVLDFGLNSFTSRNISRDPGSFGSQFPVMLGLRVLLMGLYAVAGLGTGLALGYRGAQIGLLCGTLLIQSLTILLQFVRSNVAAFQRFRADGVLSITDRLLMVLLCGTLLFLPATAAGFQISWFVWSQVFCYATAVVVGLVLLRRITKVPLRVSFQVSQLGTTLREAAPYALLILLMSVYMRSDAPLIERLVSGKEAGVYASAYRQLDVCNMFSILFAGILLPLYGKMLSERQDVGDIARFSTNLLIPFALLGTVLAWTCGSEIMHLLYHDATPYHGQVFAWVMGCLPAYSLMYIYSTLLTANGSLRLLNKLAAGAAILNVGANLYMIPHYGALGAAHTAFVTQWAIAICSVIAAVRMNGISVPLRWVGALAAYAVLLITGGVALDCFWTGNWVPEALILSAFAVLTMFALRLLHPSALLRFLSRR
jgi:O-antigen/teichoic acid export membrane protein